MMTLLSHLTDLVKKARIIVPTGSVKRSVGVLIESAGPAARLGEKCLLHADGRDQPILCEVVGFTDSNLLLMPFDDVHRVHPGSTVEATGEDISVPVGEAMLGRMVDALGRPIDGAGPIRCSEQYPVDRDPPPALDRKNITRVLPLGIRAIDGLLTCGVGQRMGIFAGPGHGKSMLLGMMARNTAADVNVIGLIGERGREVGEFVQNHLGPKGLERSVLVVATSDQPAVLRMRGAQVATSIAEYFRDLGNDVLLMMDSVTRFAWAKREIGLATGEPPTRDGYTPSVFADLPRLLERGGNAANGSITTLCTVLVESSDFDNPIASAVRATLDGHIVLSQALAAKGHYPAIDVLESVSRVMPQICAEDHLTMAQELCAYIAAYAESEDLINLGAYVKGTNPQVDRAIVLKEPIDIFLRQQPQEATTFDDTVNALEEILSIPQPESNAKLAPDLQDANPLEADMQPDPDQPPPIDIPR